MLRICGKVYFGCYMQMTILMADSEIAKWKLGCFVTMEAKDMKMNSK